LSIMDRMQSRGSMQAKLGKMPQMRQVVPGHVLPSIDPSSFTKRASTKKKDQTPTIPQQESPDKEDESPVVTGRPTKPKAVAQHNMQDFADLMDGKNKQE